MTSADIPKRMEQLLKEKGMTMYEVIAKCGVADATGYSTYSGKSMPRIDNLERICDGFGVTLGEFFNPEVEVSKTAHYTLKQKELLEVCSDLNSSNMDRVIAYAEGIKERKQ